MYSMAYRICFLRTHLLTSIPRRTLSCYIYRKSPRFFISTPIRHIVRNGSFQQPEKEILTRIACGDYLPKLRSVDNRKQLPSLNTNEFDRMLSCLRQDIPFNNFKVLTRAPYVAHCVDDERQKRFLSLVDKWWIRAEEWYRNCPFKVTSILHNLGIFNAKTGGVVLKKIGGERTVDFLISRWLEIGFDNFYFEDTLSGLTGIRHFCFDGCTGKLVIDKKLLKRWDDLVSACEQYCVKKLKAADPNEEALIASNGFGLSMLSQLRHLNTRVSRETLMCLNDWALMSIREVAEGVNCEKNSALSEVQIEARLANYADTWLYLRIDPDSLKPDSLTTWFNVAAVLLASARERPIFLHNLLYFPCIALYFRRKGDFFKLYDDWHESVLKSIQKDSEVSGFRHHAVHLADLIFPLGKVVQRSPRDLSKKIDSLVSELMRAFCNIKPSLISQRTVGFAVTGYTNTKRTLFPAGGTLPDDISKFLRCWFASVRQTAGIQPEIASTAILIFYMCAKARMDVPDSVREDVTKLVFSDLTRFPDEEMTQELWKYAFACCKYRYDPSKIVEQAWPEWFRHAARCIGKNTIDEILRKPDSKYAVSYHCRLIKTTLTVTAAFGRFEEFGRVQSIWERSAISVLPLVADYVVESMRDTVKQLERRGKCRFGKRFRRALEDRLRSVGTFV